MSLDDAIARHGPDALRYFLLREVGFETDGNFTWERFDARYTADLADTFGNLVSRTLSMVHRYRDGVVPTDPQGFRTPLEEAGVAAVADYRRAMDALDLLGGAEVLLSLATRANRYVEETVPWKLAKSGDAPALDSVLANLVRVVARLAILALPFMPGKSAEIWELLESGRALDALRLSDLDAPAVEGLKVRKPPILFPKPVSTP